MNKKAHLISKNSFALVSVVSNFNMQIIIILSVLVFLSLCFYVYQVQDLIKKGYNFSIYQKRILQTQTQSQNLFLAQTFDADNSLEKIEKIAISRNFIQNDTIQYVPLSNDYLVAKTR